ncbi:MAG: LppX_LprAFG lipoprotein [Marmoricola sp.]
MAFDPLPRRLRPLALALLAGTLLLSGCGGSSAKADEPSPAEVMKVAKKNFDDASSVHIALSTSATPSSGNGVLGADGDLTQAPAFQGEVKVVLGGLTATVPITSLDGKVYAKLPLQTKFAVIKPSEYGAPDPADFADPATGLSSLLTQMKDLKKGSEKRSSDQILTSYSGTVPGAAVKAIIPSADTASTYKTVVGIDEKGFATTVKVTGKFFAGNDDTTYDVKFDQYDKGVTITAPAA